ncbi:MAG TPA: glutamine synthetase, partial [Bacteroidales bacterium]|nr:glutamine synthetase [Bacteroidales bacterium]HPT51827.1 glutamine synthetase [Bacteroidales bacterium]
MKDDLALNMNEVVNYLKKSPKEFTKADMIKFVEEKEIKMINFRYVAGDGRLKSLNFIINNREYLEQILSCGERVDGSNIFPAFMHAGSSDLYVIPRFR